MRYWAGLLVVAAILRDSGEEKMSEQTNLERRSGPAEDEQTLLLS
jgi:hypothetical protein